MSQKPTGRRCGGGGGLNAFGWKAKWYLQDTLEEAGIEYRKGRLPPRPFVEVDGMLYTGQTPPSPRTRSPRGSSRTSHESTRGTRGQSGS